MIWGAEVCSLWISRVGKLLAAPSHESFEVGSLVTAD